MISTTTALDALSAALVVARRNGREVRSIKDLLCDACGVAVALRGDYCHACADEMNAMHDATREAHALALLSQEEPDGFAAQCSAAYDDAEGAAMLAGMNPGKM